MSRATICLALFLACSLGSCTIATEIEVFNNTLVPVQLVINGDVYRLKPGKDTTIYERELSHPIVETDSITWTYVRPTRIPESFIAWRGWGFWQSRVATVQIESDGRIWLLGVNQSAPVSEFVEQPEGFPLTPNVQ
jgi:hypothetical protein